MELSPLLFCFFFLAFISCSFAASQDPNAGMAPGFDQKAADNVHRAVLYGMEDALRSELRMDPTKLELKSQEKLTPLLVGCKFFKMEIIEFLIEYGANINAKDQNQTTCLHFLCQKPDLQQLKTFFELVESSSQRLKVNTLDHKELSPLYYCTAQSTDSEGPAIVNLLADHGANINSRESSALVTAIGHNQYGIAETLLERGGLIQTNEKGYSAFIYLFHGPFRRGVTEASPMNFSKRLKLLKSLIKAAKEQNVFFDVIDSAFHYDRTKWTTLYLAFRERDFGAVTTLLQAGAGLLEREADMPTLWDNLESYDIDEKYVNNPLSRILFLETRDWTVKDVSFWLKTLVDHFKIRENFVGLRGAQLLKLKEDQIKAKTKVLEGTADEAKIQEILSQIEEMKSGRRTGEGWSRFWGALIREYPEFSPDAVLQTTTASALADSASNIL